jgi:type III secretion protein J
MNAPMMARAARGLALVAALLLAGCGAKVDLLATIAERDANEVMAELLNKGISVTKVAGKDGNVGLQVNQSDMARAVDILRVAGLPRESFKAIGQVFSKDGLISSPVEERARYLYALSQELSGTLANLDGVLFARVHLVLPERGTGLDKGSPSSAAVFIKHRVEYDIELLQPQVRRLVANSIPDLSVDRVTVVLVSSSAKVPDKAQSVSVWGAEVPPLAAAPLRTFGYLMIGLLVLAVGALATLGYLLVRRNRAVAAPTQEGG